MIDVKDIIRLKIPYPNFNSNLACKAHLYICSSKNKNSKCFLKVQSIKPQHFKKMPCKHYFIWQPNANNPLKKPSFIDLDKQFQISNIIIPLELGTKPIKSISHHLFLKLIQYLKTYDVYHFQHEDILKLNNKCKVKTQ